MDLRLEPDQRALAELAAVIFRDLATPERVAVVEASEDRVDATLWKALAGAGLLGLSVPAEFGGSGQSLLETALVLEQQGRRVAPVPLWPLLGLALPALVELGTPSQRERWLPGAAAGSLLLTAALEGVDPWREQAPVRADADGRGFVLTGRLTSVPAGHIADRVLVPVRCGAAGWLLAWLDPAGPGVSGTRAVTTDRGVHAHFELAGAPLASGDSVAVAAADVARLVQVGVATLCALHAGVIGEAVRMTATYLGQRHQFGRAIGTFQAVAGRAADAYIDLAVARLAALQACGLLAAAVDAPAETALAKWWTAEAGHRCLHTALHLHGGIGNDVEYPLHRYFLWSRQLGLTLGGPEQQLSRLAALAGRLR